MNEVQHAGAAPKATWQGAIGQLLNNIFSLGRVRRAAAVLWMNALIAVTVLVAAAAHSMLVPESLAPNAAWPQRSLALFAVWLLAFVPGWLYVRFLCLRKEALWNEYVLNLYRLGIDCPEFLPQPPEDSGYAHLPGAKVGGDEQHNIYRQKFNAYYGRKISAGVADDAREEHSYVRVDTLFPVFLCTVTLAAAWTAILWNPVVLMNPVEPWASLEFGFLGAYTFSVSMLIRRFYQSDLRPSAYAAVVLRIVVVLVILVVVHQFFAITGARGTSTLATQYVSAFVVGFFPLVGLQALERVAAKALHVLVPTMAPEYPLDQIDGLNIWYEARLVEEGVEDMQNLATVNLVDVILHTRAPVGRLIDWIDQAHLLIHLVPANRKALKLTRMAGGALLAQQDEASSPLNTASTRIALRRMGIRTATDLLRAFHHSTGAPELDVASLAARGIDPEQIKSLCRLLAAEPGLDPVWNWRDGGRCRVSKRNLDTVRYGYKPTSPGATVRRPSGPRSGAAMHGRPAVRTEAGSSPVG